MTVLQALSKAKEMLNNVPDRDVDAAWIVCASSGLSRAQLHLDRDKELTEKQEQLLNEILLRRQKREPLQYIFGSVPFLNVEIKTDSRALIPRDETAYLCENAISIIKQKNYSSILDLCTGSGAIAVCLKVNLPKASVSASDISASALTLAKENAQANNAEIEFIESDLFAEILSRKFDCIISNPPYIPTKDIEKLEKELTFEPQNALDGGSDGLDFYRDIIDEAKDHLNLGGMLMFEIGFDQADAVKALLAKKGFTDIFLLKDYSNLDRIVYCFYEE